MRKVAQPFIQEGKCSSEVGEDILQVPEYLSAEDGVVPLRSVEVGSLNAAEAGFHL